VAGIYLVRAEEPEVTMTDIPSGAYYLLTDKTWESGNPESFRYLIQGYRSFCPMIGAFAFLTNDADPHAAFHGLGLGEIVKVSPVIF
jgi:hypothetical protein